MPAPKFKKINNGSITGTNAEGQLGDYKKGEPGFNDLNSQAEQYLAKKRQATESGLSNYNSPMKKNVGGKFPVKSQYSDAIKAMSGKKK